MNSTHPPEGSPAVVDVPIVAAALRTSLDIVIAPARAYRAIAASRSWIVPYLLVMIVDLAAAILSAPAAAHVFALRASTVPGAIAPGTAATVENLFIETMVPLLLWWPVLAIVLVLLAPRGEESARSEGRTASLSTLFALCVYASLPLAIGNAVDAVAIRLHDPATFATIGDLNTAFPLSLASLLPDANAAERAFLGGIDIFLIWSLLLTAYGYVALTKVRLSIALAATFSVSAVGLCLTALGSGS